MLELRNFDLNLLVAFDLLMQEQNVSRAAERMFVGQSAISHTLQRLRHWTIPCWSRLPPA
jgi:DNA-binding transcriptional LysR family regulator